MNIFYTDSKAYVCATNHCKVHVRKMIVEYAQLLSTAHHVLDGDKAPEGIYKMTHVNHPCAIWVRQSDDNYYWLLDLLSSLLWIYERKTGKQHATASMVDVLQHAPLNIPIGEFTEPPKCMPDEFKQASVEDSYKAYLNHKYNDWTTRKDKRKMKVEWYYSQPSWVNSKGEQHASI